MSMWLEQVWSYLRGWFNDIASRCSVRTDRLPSLSKRNVILISLAGLIVYAVLLRCLHLLNSDHYYIISADSYFFHWLAQRVMAGEGPPLDALYGSIWTLHSGLSYPLVYLARALGDVFNLSSPEALNVASKLLPPLLGAITLAVIFLAAARMFNWGAALFAALAWAILVNAMGIGAAGYLDRDGLSALLLTTGVLLFYFSRTWQVRIGGRDVRWLVGGLGVVAVEGLLYLEWAFVGPVLLLVVITTYFVVRFLVGYLVRLEKETSVVPRLRAAAADANWRAFAVIVVANLAMIALYRDQLPYWYRLLLSLVQRPGGTGIAELQGLSLADILSYRFLLIPIIAGLYVAVKRRSEGGMFVACWLFCLLVLSTFAVRLQFYAVPAACFLCGVGMIFIWGWMRKEGANLARMAAVAILLVLLIVPSFSDAYSLGSGGRIAPDNDWEDALSYVRNSTPDDAVIMTQWSYGYWILDLGQRRPLVDNGYYGYNDRVMGDICTAYVTEQPEEAVQIMNAYGADYLIFAEHDLDLASAILECAGSLEDGNELPKNSLVVRSLSGEFESGGGLQVVHRSEPDGEVVILGLARETS